MIESTVLGLPGHRTAVYVFMCVGSTVLGLGTSLPCMCSCVLDPQCWPGHCTAMYMFMCVGPTAVAWAPHCHVCVHVCLWMPEYHPLFLTPPPSRLETGSLTEPKALDLARLAVQRSPWLYVPSTRVTCMCQHDQLPPGCQAFNLRSSCMSSKHLTDQTIS